VKKTDHRPETAYTDGKLEHISIPLGKVMKKIKEEPTNSRYGSIHLGFKKLRD